ncbi:MAG: ABC transporter permease [Archaeoglobus sp.]|nr:ABC transporter permease [Archaeoglobus sp.]
MMSKHSRHLPRVSRIFKIFRVSSIELKKSRKKYSKTSFLILILISLVSISLLYFSVGFGMRSDSYLYEVSGMQINDYRFLNSKNSDVHLTYSNGYYKAIITGTDKSLAAVDELRKLVKQNYEFQLYERFGSEAFPVFVKAEFLEREKVSVPSIKNLSIPEIKKYDVIPEGESKVGKGEEIIKESLNKLTSPQSNLPIKQKTGYTIPEDFNPQSLLSKMVLAFFFIIPSYFTIQLFSASLLEDKTLRRLDVLLSTPLKPIEIYIGKLLPYLVISSLFIISTSFLLKESLLAILFVLPFILFAFSLQACIVFLSRSYKEMTFLIMVSSFIITAYLFIPAIFSGTIPVSKISPITNMLILFETGELDLSDYLLSTSQFYILFAVLSFISIRMMDAEVMYLDSIERKVLLTLRKWIKSPLHCLFASILSIPFVFIAEFMLISIIFTMPLQLSIAVFILGISLVEELFKTSIVYAAYKNSYKNSGILAASVLTAVGFFAGEKILALIEIGRNYMDLLLASYLLLPLALHLLTLFCFAFLIRKRSYAIAFSTAVVVHFIYDYGILLALGGVRI